MCCVGLRWGGCVLCCVEVCKCSDGGGVGDGGGWCGGRNGKRETRWRECTCQLSFLNRELGSKQHAAHERHTLASKQARARTPFIQLAVCTHNQQALTHTCTAASRCCILRRKALSHPGRTVASIASAAVSVADDTSTALVAAETLPARLPTADCRAASRRLRAEFSSTNRLSCVCVYVCVCVWKQ